MVYFILIVALLNIFMWILAYSIRYTEYAPEMTLILSRVFYVMKHILFEMVEIVPPLPAHVTLPSAGTPAEEQVSYNSKLVISRNFSVHLMFHFLFTP
jgi:hypothetical protein